MFLPGAERKVGTVSGSVKYYWNDWQMEGVFIPAHEGNRFPFGEEAFPLNIPMSSPELIDEEPGSEFGFRIQSTLRSSDFSLSYLDGRDRSFSYVGMTNSMPSFFYRNTSVLGFDLVSFIGDFTNRFEIGYFSTENDAESDMKTLNDGSYIQFAGQVEYSTENDIMFSLQIIGSEILEIDGTTTEDEFQPGIGTPFAMPCGDCETSTTKSGEMTMALVRWQPSRAFGFGRDIDHLFEHFWGSTPTVEGAEPKDVYPGLRSGAYGGQERPAHVLRGEWL